MRIAHIWRRWSAAVPLLLVALLALITAGPAQAATRAATGKVTFSGQATVVRATVLGTTTVLADTGPLPSAGDALDASLLTANVPGLLSAEVLHAATIGQGDRSRSEASVANVNNLTVGGNTISADFLMARATAICTSTGPSTNGSSQVVALRINGQPIIVTGLPNQTVNLPGGGQIVINEQTSSPGKITVNALHVVIPGVADVIIASAHADVQCSKGKPNCAGKNDFVTGGGWIITPSGAKGNFGVAGGIKNGAYWGHLIYIDHGIDMKVKGTGVTAYVITPPTSRHIEGTAEVNGQPGFTYQVDVTDNGEPGTNDTFTIKLSNGYSASGTLAGGNIQLHMPCQ
jgi:hypothetical protein